jgi:hypothetical protein
MVQADNQYPLDESTYLMGQLVTGQAVTITLYDASTGAVVPLTSAVCAEMGATGIYVWSTTNITTYPIVRTEYIYWMTEVVTPSSDYGKVVLGGVLDVVDTIDGKVDTVDTVVDTIETNTDTIIDDIESLDGDNTDRLDAQTSSLSDDIKSLKLELENFRLTVKELKRKIKKGD